MTYTLYVGLEKDGEGNPLSIPMKSTIADVEKDTAETFGGYSAIPVYGGWIEPTTHSLIREKSLRIEVTATDIPHDKVIAWAKYVKFRFQQKTVLLVESSTTETFVS